MMWRTLVRCVGGVYRVGRAAFVLHDNGAYFAWDLVIKWDYRR